MSFAQIGTVALRDPVTGSFLPSLPLFVRGEDSERLTEPMEYDLKKLAGKVEEYRKEAARLEKEAEARKEARRKSRKRKPGQMESEK